MKYSTIRKEYQHHELSSMVFVDPYATLLSPFVTKLCLRLRLIPNAVTLGMIGSGIVGAVLFALPFLWGKILGTVFIHLWYVFDCSDGEVARITKRFSKFGTEIDYTAHVVNHPLFLFSFLLTLLQADTGWSTLSLCLIFFGVVALNLMFRVWILFGDIYKVTYVRQRETLCVRTGDCRCKTEAFYYVFRQYFVTASKLLSHFSDRLFYQRESGCLVCDCRSGCKYCDGTVFDV